MCLYEIPPRNWKMDGSNLLENIYLCTLFTSPVATAGNRKDPNTPDKYCILSTSLTQRTPNFVLFLISYF
jgi:hypothetical protein